MKYKKEALTYTCLITILILLSVWMFATETKLSHLPFSPYNPQNTGTMALSEVLKNKGTIINTIDTLQDIDYDSNNDALVIVTPNKIPKKYITELEENTNKDIIYLNIYNTDFDGIYNSNNSDLNILDSKCKTDNIKPQTKISASFLSLTVDENTIKNDGLYYEINKCFPIVDNQETSYAYIEKISYKNKITYIADPTIFTNKQITKNSNAALAINLFNKYENIYWYMPSDTDFTDTQTEPKPSITPTWANQIFLLLSVATIFLLIAKGKRLGFVVKENLPVIIKFEETNRGKANLYRKNSDQEYTAKILRTYHIQKLTKLVRINPHTNKEDFINAISEKTSIKYEDLEKILYTQETQSNEELHVLSLSLESIEKKVKDGKQ